MKIISFGDIHEDYSNLIPLKNELENADLVIVTGDLTNFNGRKEAEKGRHSYINFSTFSSGDKAEEPPQIISFIETKQKNTT